MINRKYSCANGAVKYRPSAALMNAFAFQAWVNGNYKVAQDVPVTVKRRRNNRTTEVAYVSAYK